MKTHTEIMNEPLMPSKQSYEAAEFYERYVDRLHNGYPNDEKYPHIPLSGIIYHCCTNRDAVTKLSATPHYSQQRFHKMVADAFETTIKEMNQHWRSF